MSSVEGLHPLRGKQPGRKVPRTFSPSRLSLPDSAALAPTDTLTRKDSTGESQGDHKGSGLCKATSYLSCPGPLHWRGEGEAAAFTKMTKRFCLSIFF